jgi:glutamyl-tRNA reductase
VCAFRLNQADTSIPVGRCPYIQHADEAPACMRETASTGRLARQGDQQLHLIGLNHQTAEIGLREQLFDQHLDRLLSELRALGIAEVAVLFTCNRIEIYAVMDSVAAGQVVAHLAARAQISQDDLRPHLYEASGDAAALHLMRVAAGLESLVLGEPQILGQVAEAAARARHAGTLGAVLNRLFDAAVHAGKRARTETAISRHTLSISHAAVLLARKLTHDLTAARILVIGAGEMARLAIEALQHHGARSIALTNRTAERGQQLAAARSIEFHPWSHLRQSVDEADVVVSAVASVSALLFAADMPSDGRSRILIDVGVPRNIDPGAGAVPGIRLHDVDDLRQVVEEHRIQRQQEASRVERILSEELQRLRENELGQQMGPIISELRDRVESLIHGELSQALRRLPALDDRAQATLNQMAQRIAGKLLHAPTIALKTQEDPYTVELVRRIFELPPGQENGTSGEG